MDLEDVFEKIANDAITRASMVECSAAAYRDGLRTIIYMCETEISASEKLDEKP